jgi:hypothetical protein
VFVGHSFNNNQLGDGFEGGSFRIKLHSQVTRRSDRLASCRKQGIIHGFKKHFALDAFVSLKKVQSCQDFAVHTCGGARDKKKWVH